MDAHLQLLLALATRCDSGDVSEDDLYVWWGKIRSPNRQQPLAHQHDVLELANGLDLVDETHLYLTDYQSLYVGEVDAIVARDVAAEDPAHVPEYYSRLGYHCDFWFRIRDVRALVVHDLPGVTSELRKLRNTRYNDRPVSIYGGMVELPLIATRDDDRRFFDPDERERYTGGLLWAEWDAQNGGGVWGMERELRDNRFGDDLWVALDPATRRFIASAERAYRDRRADPAFDFAQCMGGYAKAIEVQANLVLRAACAKLSPAERRARVDGQTVDLSRCRSLTLGELARVVASEHALNAGLQRTLHNGGWFAAQLPPIIDSFVQQVRNPGAHESRIDRAMATYWRNRLIGVGSSGDLVELARTRPR